MSLADRRSLPARASNETILRETPYQTRALQPTFVFYDRGRDTVRPFGAAPSAPPTPPDSDTSPPVAAL